MKKFSLVAIFVSFLPSFHANAEIAIDELNCSAPDGSTVTGTAPGGLGFDLTVRTGGKSARVSANNGNANNAMVVQDLQVGVYTMYIDVTAPTPAGFVQLYAIPKTVTYKENSNGYTATFSAILQFALPGISWSQKTCKCTINSHLPNEPPP